MPLTLDHVVIAVHDLERAIADYAALGFHVLRGGDHPGRSTHNALVVFSDGSYFELIAWREPAPAERWWQLLQRHGEGIVDFALLPRDTAVTVADAKARGLVLEGPLDGGRVRPDGEHLCWQTARAPSADLPFLCGDLTRRALRVPEGAARVHPNGVLGVASLAIAVRDLDATLARYRALLGTVSDDTSTHIGEPVAVPASQVRVAVIALGSSVLVLSSPRDRAPAAELGGDALAQRLAVRGEGPYALVLHTDRPQSTGTFDLARAHGAWIELDLPPVDALEAQGRVRADAANSTVGG
ncbi:catechol 2,3-dioxygenase-like lactoylglutathione lyase family enzyme [Variovorax boronicumulans]|uniref:Catechol 2,3-dioxygenase-like lactoylglutathione lyase family enzyme n=1 Tax=Variovorax boronicumulans TaxID=436515 RepID=A0AAW8E522_9BURK|nr:VOC family protein [Variovorax boronicumulans]MDP9881702.1 catechol 2,3-dioxygenase-like lactoylglutathione lyase family enzyme [Variovorax boronicumulans]MDP9926985.1 catechol 2,3-dioxygenase-like lactoylglutathione lyase family enzyme [Variovorax boronicumulans]